MAKSNVKKNYLYNLIYQVFSLITPLITTPYVSRVLSGAGVGQYSFTYSLVSYFVLFGALGFGVYAQREIARIQDDKKEQSRIFWEIIIARCISVGITLLIYIGLILSGIYKDYTNLMWILSINVISTLFDITFLFQGNEKFGVIALRNIIIKIVGISLIFIFVKNERDVWIYSLCQSIILIFSNLSLWPSIPKLLCKVKFADLKIKRHFIPTLRLFIPTIAVSVYTMLDKTLIGLMIPGNITSTNEAGEEIVTKISDLENGYYEQSEKMVKMVLTIITSLGTVMIPRNSQEIASGNVDGFKKNIYGALRFVAFLGIPLMFGLAAVAKNFSPWFYGKGYEKVPYLIMIISPLIMIIGLSNVLGLQYLIPLKKDSKYTIAICSGAAINLCLNLILIPLLWSYGAAIATVAAEALVTTTMFVFARKDISFLKIIKDSWKYFVSGIAMFVILFLFFFEFGASILNSCFMVLFGTLIYFVSLFILKDKFFIDGFFKILNKLKNNRFGVKSNSKVRDLSLDFLKVIATFGVVVLNTVNKDLSLFNYILYCFGVFSIPIFFMVDGALLLNKKEVSFKYSLRKINSTLKLVMCWVIIGFICNILLSKSLDKWYLDVFGWFIQKGFFNLFWFFGSLLIIYSLLPLLHYIYNKKILLIVFMVVLFALCLTTHGLSIFTSITNESVFEKNIIQTFRLYNWLLYFFLGGLFYKNRTRFSNARKNIAYCLTLTLLCIVYCVLMGKYVMALNFVEYLYNSPVIICGTCVIFFTILSIHFTNNRIYELSKASIAVYILHYTFVLRIFNHFNPANIFVWSITPLLIFFICTVIGLVTSNIKYINKLFVL